MLYYFPFVVLLAERYTSVRFDEFRNHYFFSGVNWTQLEEGDDEELHDFPTVKELMVENADGKWSPRPETVALKSRRKKRLLHLEKFLVS